MMKRPAALATVLTALVIAMLSSPGIAWSQQSEGASASNPAQPQPAAAQPQPAAAQPQPAAAQPAAAQPQPAAAQPATAQPAATGGQMNASTYVVRLRDLESRVDELKEQIRRSHTRLSLLSDTVLSGGVGGAQAEISFRNDMSNAFRVTEVLFVLDGAVQYKKKDDTGALSEQKNIPIFNGAVPPGDHTLQVVVVLRGHGYGVFSYLRGYTFEVKSTHSFTVAEGKTAQVEAVAWEKGGVTTPLEERPNLRFTEKTIGQTSFNTKPGTK